MGRSNAGGSGPSGVTRVLLVDMSVGFGGATKSAALISAKLGTVESFVLTSQDPQIVHAWYGHMQVFSFHRFLNYRNRWRLASLFRLIRIPGAQRAAAWIFTVADMVAGPWHLLRTLQIVISKKIELIHLQNGFYPPEALLAGRLLGVPVVVHLRSFFSGPDPTTFGARLSIVGDSRAVLASVPELCLLGGWLVPKAANRLGFPSS